MKYYGTTCDALSVICALNNRAFDAESVGYNPHHKYAIDCWYEGRKKSNELMLVVDPRVFSEDVESECFVTPLRGFRPSTSGFARLAAHLEHLATERDGEVDEYVNSLIDGGCEAREAEEAGAAVRGALLFAANRISAMFSLNDGKEGV